MKIHFNSIYILKTHIQHAYTYARAALKVERFSVLLKYYSLYSNGKRQINLILRWSRSGMFEIPQASNVSE